MRVLVRQREVVLCTIDFRSTYAIVIYLALLATLVLFCGSELPKPAFYGCAYIHLRNSVAALSNVYVLGRGYAHHGHLQRCRQVARVDALALICCISK